MCEKRKIRETPKCSRIFLHLSNARYSYFSETVLRNPKHYGENLTFSTFEELYTQYVFDLKETVKGIYSKCSKAFSHLNASTKNWVWAAEIPCTVVSLFEEGCIEKGLSYLEGGPIYNLYSPHIGGVADTVNSLYAIKKLVFDEQKCSFSELMEILKSNWEQDEALRMYALNQYSYYGNDSDEVDQLAARLLSDFADICTELNGRCGYRFPAGVSTFGRQLEWAPKRFATPYGRYAGDILAANCSPTPSTDKDGATAIIRSYCKIDHSKLASGSALDIKLLPSNVAGELGLQAMVSLLKAFVSLGGFFMQPDTVDAATLREAQRCPQDYQTLSVRISGWNARFVTLNKEWQDMVIAQNEH